MKQVSMKLMPCLLIVDKKDGHLSICTDLHVWARNNETISSTITGDETCVWIWPVNTVNVLLPVANGFITSIEECVMVNVKCLVIAIFNINGLVSHEFVTRHCPENWCTNNWILHHDNAPVHRSATTNEFWIKHNIPLFSHTSYSPDHAQYDCFCFHKFQNNDRSPRWWSSRDSSQCIEANEGFTRKCLSEMFPWLAAMWYKCIQ